MELPLPPHWNPARVGEVWRVDYEARAVEAAAWTRRHRIRPAREDERRVCLFLVDVQNTFCTPGFELFVPGAPDDSRRLCEFLYRNLGSITQVVATLDTHQALQVFHAAWLVDTEGHRPASYTAVSVEDVEQDVWRATDPAEQESLLEYVRALAERGRYQLTVWPYHAMLGGIGHALVSAVEEAVFFHSVARSARVEFRIKGDRPPVEHYSALGPEVGERDDALVDLLRGCDEILVAGQAKSHCVAWTLEDLLAAAPELAERLVLLEDCTSPVVVPGAVDFTAEASAAFDRFAEAGARVVSSGDPLA